MNRSETSSTSSSPTLPLLRSDKITLRHQERLAVVYVRQSTPQQLVRHHESTEVQYRLKLRAQELGWAPERVLVIDDDLGKTATTVEGRLGFQRLVAEVTLDHVGIVFGIEMSRLARSCKDWYQLLEVCAVFSTLIADWDGVYDPTQYNDRLLLGLKGTMSEAELHILKQRMNEGRLNKARRGELLISVPIGYVRRPSGEVSFDPDEQAREVVKLVFQKFEELGTINAVLRYLVQNGVSIPVRSREGLTKGDLEWHHPNRTTLQNMLKNPMYAGAYAYGRRAVDPRKKIPGRPSTGRGTIRPADCQVFLKDRFPAYISWGEYDGNQERLKANRAIAEARGAPRHGRALLAGLAVCGKCGSRLSVRYTEGGRHVYRCSRLVTDYGGASCQHMAGPPLDTFIRDLVLRALEPASLELSLRVAEDIKRQRRQLDGLWQKRLERARYETARAVRCYHHVEPENRLVARQLEREWEEKLRNEKSLAEEYDRFLREQPRVLRVEEREEIRRLAADIPRLWLAPTTTMAERKDIIRQVIDRIVINVVGESECVDVAVHWAGGMQTGHRAIRPVARLRQLTYWPEIEARLRSLAADKLTARQIAERLNAEGLRPPKRTATFSEPAIHRLLQRLGLTRNGAHPRRARGLGENEWLLSALARELDMPATTLYSWLRRKWIQGRQDSQGLWVVRADLAEVERLRRLRKVPLGQHIRARWIKARQTQSPTEARDAENENASHGKCVL